MSQTRYSDDPEIRKIQEHAEQLGIYEIICNIICEGRRLTLQQGQSRTSEWEGCILNFRRENFQYSNGFSDSTKSKKISSLFSITGFQPNISLAEEKQAFTISIKMPDGTILFNAQKMDGEVYISVLVNG